MCQTPKSKNENYKTLRRKDRYNFYDLGLDNGF